jgi:glyoxylase-like metal-dependent hydrolase (beta-lactamase superfamily II)
LERVECHGVVERLQMAHAIAGRVVYWTSVYLAPGGVLVDSGCARGRVAVARFLAQRPVATVLTTHEHEDHVGNHAALPRGAEVFAPGRAIAILDDGPPRLPFYRWLAWGSHEKTPHIAKRVGDAVAASGRRFRVVPTPGHSGDHVVYVDEDAAAVYSGDAWFGKLRAVREKEDVPEQMRSLRRIADLDPAVLYPTHGPIVERPRARLLDVADHFDALGEKARTLASERGWSARRIRRELMGRESGLYWFSQGAFSAENIVKSLLRRA